MWKSLTLVETRAIDPTKELCSIRKSNEPAWETCFRVISQRPSSLVHISKINARLNHPVPHRHLGLPHPHARIIEALVGLVETLRVADLALQKSFIHVIEIQNALPICPLRIGIYIHLHNTIAHRSINIGLL